MIPEERDALRVLERVAMERQDVFGLLTSFRCGGSLVEALGEALALVHDDPLVDGEPLEDALRTARAWADQATREADRARAAADDAEEDSIRAEDRLGKLEALNKRKGAHR